MGERQRRRCGGQLGATRTKEAKENRPSRTLIIHSQIPRPKKFKVIHDIFNKDFLDGRSRLYRASRILRFCPSSHLVLALSTLISSVPLHYTTHVNGRQRKHTRVKRCEQRSISGSMPRRPQGKGSLACPEQKRCISSPIIAVRSQPAHPGKTSQTTLQRQRN